MASTTKRRFTSEFKRKAVALWGTSGPASARSHLPLRSRVQYAAGSCVDHLMAIGATYSMSHTGNCYDNAPMESFFHTINADARHRPKRAKRRSDTATATVIGTMHPAIRYLSPSKPSRA